MARVYLRVSTDEQDLQRQEAITGQAKAAGYYVAGIYREKASGARPDRPDLLRMVADLQPGSARLGPSMRAQVGLRQRLVSGDFSRCALRDDVSAGHHVGAVGQRKG